MANFEYVNGIHDKEVDYIIDFISKEARYLKRVKHNLTRFAYVESKNGRLRLMDFQRITSELERLAKEIDFLEQTRTVYINIKNR
jgi:hypothetical protein